MRTTFVGVDVVDVSLDVFGVGSVVRKRYFYRNALAFTFKVDDVTDERLAVAIEVRGKFFKTTL